MTNRVIITKKSPVLVRRILTGIPNAGVRTLNELSGQLNLLDSSDILITIDSAERTFTFENTSTLDTVTSRGDSTSNSVTFGDLNVTGQTTLSNLNISNLNITTLSVDSAVISGITFTDSALSQFLDSDDFVFSSGQASLKDESIQDIIGAMVSGNTETNITVTYQDGDGTIDFEVPIASADSVGVAQFDSNEFNVVAGLVTMNTIDGGSF
jgi:hypothetical protein